MDSDLKRFEQELERLSPGSLPEGLISRMEAAMEGWEKGAEDLDREARHGAGKVVPFPPRPEEGLHQRTGPSLLAAAAGVAILGALAGLVLSVDPEEIRSEGNAALAHAAGERLQPVEFAPQAARRKLVSASKDRMVIADGGQLLRVMRLDYVDRVEFRNEDGEELHVEVPAVSYRLIPMLTD